jgi:hypothetical protein
MRLKCEKSSEKNFSKNLPQNATVALLLSKETGIFQGLH